MDSIDDVKQYGQINEGELFEDLKDLSTRYCEYSPGQELNGRKIIGFIVENE